MGMAVLKPLMECILYISVDFLSTTPWGSADAGGCLFCRWAVSAAVGRPEAVDTRATFQTTTRPDKAAQWEHKLLRTGN